MTNTPAAPTTQSTPVTTSGESNNPPVTTAGGEPPPAATAGGKKFAKGAAAGPRLPVFGAPLDKLLVATDFSTTATRAVGRAMRLPLSEKASITLLHVIPLGIPSKLENALWADAKKTLADAAAVAAETARSAQGRPIKVSTAVARGKPSMEILKRARQDKADLIVLGRHGRRGIRELFLGSTAERVVRLGTIPALVILNPATNPYKSPLVAVDGSDHSRRALELMLRTIVQPEHLVTVMAAYEVPFETILKRAGVSLVEIAQCKLEARKVAWNSMQAAVTPYRKTLRWQPQVQLGDPRRAILEQVARGSHDLVALGRRGRTKIAEMVLGGVAEAVLRAAPCDMLFGPRATARSAGPAT